MQVGKKHCAFPSQNKYMINIQKLYSYNTYLLVCCMAYIIILAIILYIELKPFITDTLLILKFVFCYQQMKLKWK